MHHHGYLWVGPKADFDCEALRRPPCHEPPSVAAATEFTTVDLPPIETAYWLIKPRALVRGTWNEPKEAACWLGERLAEYAPRFASEADRDTAYLARLVDRAAERLRGGADTSYGFYLGRPSYLSLAAVTCSPNRSRPELACPVA
ncbi:hypothetical protein [Streptomyces sp. NPDC003717]|uniref:hypothetical protein n=1 Tax=Streptomyces sp. NPDC003717 TaxID=3154276 RepID=UPI0033A50952